ncbi:MAG: helix-turn-helix domain-containing protein [Deltaproteobacteria bacterium]|jgi:hypothetical protein|nr:helix-turn-helix domain-containing protein [Deltaproteobacteria bacterium]
MQSAADKRLMKLEDLQKVEVAQSGPHYLVPEALMKQLVSEAGAGSGGPSDKINGLDWVFNILEIPQRGSLSVSFLLKHHRIAHDMKVRQLARLVDRDHKHILKLEAGKIREPEISVLQDLVKQLGPKFKLGLQLLGYELE